MKALLARWRDRRRVRLFRRELRAQGWPIDEWTAEEILRGLNRIGRNLTPAQAAGVVCEMEAQVARKIRQGETVIAAVDDEFARTGL